LASPETLRFRASSRYSYAVALLSLVHYARDTTGPDFAFGPLALAQLESAGLEVTGPDLSGVAQVLSGVPGLVAAPA